MPANLVAFAALLTGATPADTSSAIDHLADWLSHGGRRNKRP